MKKMNQGLCLPSAVAVILGSGLVGCGHQVEKPMNIVFFLVDDLGWMDTGCYGSSLYETPNIDRLAKEGVRFTSAYAACHVSSPTRASIISGKYPASLNLTDWLPGRLDFPFQKLRNVVINQHLPYDGTTLPEALQANGYRTAIFGKWHLGEDSASTVRQGFDVHVPDWNKGWPNNGYFPPYGLKGLEGEAEGEYLTDRLTTEALKYMEENRDRLFFLYLSHFAVHDPVEGRPDLVAKYRNKLAALPASQGSPFVMEGNPDARVISHPSGQTYEGYRIFPDMTVQVKQHQDNAEFAAMVESMDESLGRVLHKLKELGIDDQTIVIFYSDNGGMAAANFYEPGRIIPGNELDKAFSTSNVPLRGAKGWLYEGGIRVPLIVKWPGKGLSGAICDVPVTSPDFFPTILDMLGIEFQAEMKTDGVSFAPLLQGAAQIDRGAIFWHFPHYSNHGMQSPGGAVRCGDYKLIEYFENGSLQLFNLKVDLSEQNNLVDSESGKADELLELLRTWRILTGAIMMEPNPDYREGN
jgi:arylsulfatase A-like enzyme